MHKAMALSAVFLVAACATEAPQVSQKTIATHRERVAATVERIKQEQEAGKTAKLAYGELGLQADGKAAE